MVVEREGEGEVSVVRLFSDMGATEVRVEGDKLKKWHPQLGEEMEVEQTGDNDVSEGGDGGDGGGGGSSSIGGIHVEKTGGGGGGCGHDHDHSHSHSQSHSPTLTNFTSKKGQLFPCKLEKKGRYGYSIEWADGATIIYSMFSLAKAAGGIPVESSFGPGDEDDDADDE